MRLILMRHAKSDWAGPTIPDHDRPLNPRGQTSSGVIGTWLHDHGYMPDEVLCSSATRTRETLDGLSLTAPAEFVPRLYHAEPWDMLDILRGAKGACVLMIGHNPGIAEFAQDLVSEAVDHPRFQDYPTCATLVVDFNLADWPEVGPNTGRLVDFVVPRDLV